MRVLIVENFAETSLGQVGVALEEARADLTWCRPHLGETLPGDPGHYDAVVVLGGEQNAIDDAHYPYLGPLAGLMAAFGAADKSLLGICLGSQLLARAHGATNHLGTAREFGWHRVSLTEDGLSDPVLSSVPASFPIFEWHSDTFSLPKGAVHLATNGKVANQAFRVGRASYGMQFHFEANREVVAAWRQKSAPAIERLAPGWLAGYEAHLAEHGEKADAAGLAIARAWVGTIRVAEKLELALA